MKIECECGHLIHDGTDKLAHKAHFVPDQSWDGLLTTIDNLVTRGPATPAGRDAAANRIFSLLSTRTRSAWQCHQCGMLYVDGPDRELRAFRPLDGAKSAGVLSALDDQDMVTE